ncbi:hypothetical protein [Bdellovibrio sp. HCB209]|uniref:hypothetical protein n=1 Tax=Bdellovibrio sp. HCB209 TaxID=3394354 RepID=UPI0039B5BC04
MKSVLSKITLSVITLSVVLQAHTARADRGTTVVATISGAILGGLIGASIAQDFDDRDNRQSQRMWERALRQDYSDAPFAWEGDGHRGRMMFTGEGYFDGYYCRIYRSEVWNRRTNSPMVTTGYVCRAADGSWFRREAGDIREARRDRPDRGPRFDRQQRPDERREVRRQEPHQQMGGRQMGMGGQPNMGGNNGPNRGFGSPGGNYGSSGGRSYSGGGSVSSGSVVTNGDGLPISGTN